MSLPGWTRRMAGTPIIVSLALFRRLIGETYTEELEEDTSEGPVVGRECIGFPSKDIRRHAVCQQPTSQMGS